MAVGAARADNAIVFLAGARRSLQVLGRHLGSEIAAFSSTGSPSWACNDPSPRVLLERRRIIAKAKVSSPAFAAGDRRRAIIRPESVSDTQRESADNDCHSA